jgi:hypothetical protein
LAVLTARTLASLLRELMQTFLDATPLAKEKMIAA